MKYDQECHHRRSIRLPGYDYTRPGAYFITLVTHERECLFGEIVGVGETCQVALNEWGKIARAEWFQTAVVRPYVMLRDDEFVVMPNHVHGIIWIVDDDCCRGDPTGRPYTGRPYAGRPYAGRPYAGRPYTGRPYDGDDDHPRGPAAGSIGAILAQYKSVVTKGINALRGAPGVPVWQRNYYEHIIRNDRELQRIRQYILENPAHWVKDREYSEKATVFRGRQ